MTKNFLCLNPSKTDFLIYRTPREIK